MGAYVSYPAGDRTISTKLNPIFCSVAQRAKGSEKFSSILEEMGSVPAPSTQGVLDSSPLTGSLNTSADSKNTCYKLSVELNDDERQSIKEAGAQVFDKPPAGYHTIKRFPQ